MKFKVGDKVRTIKDNGTHINDYKIGHVGLVTCIDFIDKEYWIDNTWCCSENELELAQFTKSDLKDGDIVTHRNGNQRTLKGDIFVDKEGFIRGSLKFYNDNLRNINVAENDIIKVERPTKYKTVFERKEEILDEAEKRYLRGVIRPFRDNIRFISKESNYDGTEYIEIDLENSSGFFPDFKENTMYKGMKLKRGYTLQELGL